MIEASPTERVWLRVAYRVRGREGRRSVDAVVSEALPFDLPVRHEDEAPVVLRFRRHARFSDLCDAIVLGTIPDVQTAHTLGGEMRRGGDVLLRAATSPATGSPMTMRDLDVATIHAREIAVGHGRHGGSVGLAWSHYPTATTEHPRPWAMPDRSTLRLTRTHEDGREAAHAAAVTALSGACVIDGVPWLPTCPPVARVPYQRQMGVFDVEVEVPGHDYPLGADMAGIGDAQGERYEQSSLVLSHLREGLHEEGTTVEVVGDVPWPDLGAANLDLLRSALRSVTRRMQVGSLHPETAHLLTGLNLLLERHDTGVADLATTQASVFRDVGRLSGVARAHGDDAGEVMQETIEMTTTWLLTAYPEATRHLRRAEPVVDVGVDRFVP